MQKVILQNIPGGNYTLLRPIHKRRFWRRVFILIGVLLFAYGVKTIFAQTTVPLIGITSVPDPLVLPKGPSEVTYHYAVKNFVPGGALSDVHVTDNICSPVTLISGDDNSNGMLDYGETWIYTCSTEIFKTTESTATATGVANGLTATDIAHATVVVGSNTPPPLVSIVNITKVAYPLSLPDGGGPVTFTYKVTNPGVVPLSDVAVSDDQCSDMSNHLGDTNGNNLLDPSEVWIYTCTTILRQTTTNTATVTAIANGLQASDNNTITVDVATSNVGSGSGTAYAPTFPNEGPNPLVPGLPDNGLNPGLPDNGANTNSVNITLVIWGSLAGIFIVLMILFLIIRKKK